MISWIKRLFGGKDKKDLDHSFSSPDLLPIVAFSTEVLRIGVPTKIGNYTYSRELIEREISDLQGRIDKRSFFGWPISSRNNKEFCYSSSKLSEVSHLVTNLSIEDDGSVMARIEFLNTRNGKVLQRLARSGALLKFGPTGVGSIIDGVVQEDYILQSIDVNDLNEDLWSTLP